MLGAREMATDSSRDIGEQSYLNSSELLLQQKKEDLLHTTREYAADINYNLHNMAKVVKIAAKQMQEITTHPNNYQIQPVKDADEIAIGSSELYLQYAPDFHREEYEQEIGLAANVNDVLCRLLEANSIVYSIFVASKDGFVLSVDDTNVKKKTTHSLYYDAREKDWYQAALKADGVAFTDARPFLFSDALGIFCAVPYRNANGEINGVACIQASLDKLNTIVERKDFDGNSNDNFSFVIDDKGRVILSTAQNSEYLAVNLNRDLRNTDNTDLSNLAMSMASGETGIAAVNLPIGKYYIAYAPLDYTGWSFASATAEASVVALAEHNNSVIKGITEKNIYGLEQHMMKSMLYMAVFVLIFSALVAYGGRRLSQSFTRPIHELADGVRDIAGGQFDRKLDIHTGDEIEHLAVCFNSMTTELKTYMANLSRVTAEKERANAELSIATNIQTSMLPNTFPAFPDRGDFDIYATMQAAKQVGGDFYDFYLLDENHLIITIADVSGKGVPAALFMVIAKTILKNFALTMGGAEDLAPLISCTNDQLCENNDAMMFVTAFIGMLELSTGKFQYVNAGHNPPLIYRQAEHKFAYMDVKRNFVMGGMDGIDYQGQETTLEAGDRLFLYTDGVPEALSESEELYGEARLLNALNGQQVAALTLQELLAAVQKSLAAHVGKAEQSDDITMLTLVYSPEERKVSARV